MKLGSSHKQVEKTEQTASTCTGKARVHTTSAVLQRGRGGGGALRFHKVGNPEVLPSTLSRAQRRSSRRRLTARHKMQNFVGLHS